MALAAGAALAVIALGSVGLVSLDSDEQAGPMKASPTPSASTQAPPGTGGTALSPSAQPADPATFYADTRLALSPLIVHVREIPQSLNALAIPRAGTFRSLAAVASAWESDVATARDLVRRLPVAQQQTAAADAKRLYEVGALLYLQATRSIGIAAGTGSVSGRVTTAKAALRLLQLGDRTFDSAYRLLNQDGALSTQEMIFPVTVPDFDAPATAPVYDTTDAPGVPRNWAQEHAAVLRALRAQVASPASGVGVRRIRDQVKALGSSVPSEVSGREGAVTLRLAALVVAESLTPVVRLSMPLELIGQQLWRIGDHLLAQTRDTALAGLDLTIPPPEDAVVRRTLYTGGAFDGAPPPLRPGDNPGAGVPGGLPVLNSLAILGGS